MRTALSIRCKVCGKMRKKWKKIIKIIKKANFKTNVSIHGIISEVVADIAPFCPPKGGQHPHLKKKKKKLIFKKKKRKEKKKKKNLSSMKRKNRAIGFFFFFFHINILQGGQDVLEGIIKILDGGWSTLWFWDGDGGDRIFFFKKG